MWHFKVFYTVKYGVSVSWALIATFECYSEKAGQRFSDIGFLKSISKKARKKSKHDVMEMSSNRNEWKYWVISFFH